MEITLSIGIFFDIGIHQVASDLWENGRAPHLWGVRLRGMANLPLVHMWMLIVWAENVHCSVHVYDLKNAPQQRQVD